MPAVYNRHRWHPKGCLYIGRGTIAGNEFVIGVDGDRDECCDKYEAKVESDPELKAKIIEYCRGRDLLCSCKPHRCHGDYIIRISNEEPSHVNKSNRMD